MASTSRSLSLLVLACALAAFSFPTSVQAVEADELSFPMLRNANCSRQWKLSVSLSYDDGATTSPLNCSNPLLNSCTDKYPALMQDTPDQVLVSYTLATPKGNPNTTLNTWQGAQPTRYEFRICYTTNTSVNMAWRTKNKPYPRLSQNCPHKFGKKDFVGGAANVDFPDNSGSAVLKFSELDEIPTATWFVMMWVYCGDSVCAFESTEGLPAANPPVPGNFFQTEVEMGITKGMRAAAIILSIIGPAIFIAFWIADGMYYKKTGKPITLVKNL